MVEGEVGVGGDDDGRGASGEVLEQNLMLWKKKSRKELRWMPGRWCGGRSRGGFRIAKVGEGVDRSTLVSAFDGGGCDGHGRRAEKGHRRWILLHEIK